MTEIELKARRQFAGLLTNDKRWNIAVAHRRAGKTVACVQKITKAALECPLSNGRYAYVAPLYNQAKDVAWTYIKAYARQLGGDINESELRVDLPQSGARIRLYGADNPDRLRGLYLDGVVMDEYADMRPSVWGEIVRPMLADRQGWATFIGTPKGRNEFWQLWSAAQTDERWFPLMLRASETGILSASELEDAKQGMTAEQFAQEFECSFEAAILGAFYGREVADAEREGRLTELPVEDLLPVHTAWDLGMGDSTAIWFFQIDGGTVRVVDHYENHGQPLSHYASVIKAKKYRAGTDWVPHDAKVRSLETGRTRVETLFSLGLNPQVVPDHKVMDGINAVRLTLPRCHFDRSRTALGVEALRQYRTEYDEKTKAFKNTPRHDWTSHTADAFRYLAMAWRAMVPEPVSKPQPAPRNMAEMTFADLDQWVGQQNGSVRI